MSDLPGDTNKKIYFTNTIILASTHLYINISSVVQAVGFTRVQQSIRALAEVYHVGYMYRTEHMCIDNTCNTVQ